ncbi:MAG TPA: argininosuccinate lyase [Planctomycetota bacterium]|nr:argininosuccinate lyase [Planctomycetota bacterium]
MAQIIRERFSKPADEFAARFVASIDADVNLVVQDVEGSIAHAVMLGKQGILSEQELITIVHNLESILNDWKNGRFTLDVANEDVHMNIEKRLIEMCPPGIGAKLHTARSRNDQVALDLRLWTRSAAREIVEGLKKVQVSLAHKAREHAETIFPGITHLQHAQPIVFGHVLLCYYDRLGRDIGRFEDALKRTNVSPLGACAMAGTSMATNPAITALELCFGSTFTNSIDAVSDRDFAVEFTAACSVLMAHLSQMAEDLIYWSTPEFGFVELPDELCTSSSIMPQKKNPDMIELVRGKAGTVYGHLMNLLTTLKALPLGYNRDLQETKPPVFGAAETTRLSLQAIQLAVDGMKVNIDRMLVMGSDPQMLATDLAEYLAKKGMPFREAHGVIARLMKHCAEKELSPAKMKLAELRKFSEDFEKDVFDLLTPQASVQSKTSPGGTSPQQVAHRASQLLKGHS